MSPPEQEQQPPPPQQPLKPVLWTNPLTLAGLLLVGISLVLLLTFWLFAAITPPHRQTPYLGIIGYLILPMCLAMGLIICPLGMLLKRWRLKRYPGIREIPVRAALAFLGITFFVMLPAVGISGFEGYRYTESVPFCGTCHAVMAPEYTAFHRSAHTNITCADCHVGPGPGGFVSSKLTGVRQLVLYTTNSYSRPIPPALPHLEPATQICQHCHSPVQFFGWDLRKDVHFSHDARNTRHEYEVILKVGGERQGLGRPGGIHIHMIERGEYAATDERLQVIPWVKYTAADGTVTIYRSDGRPGTSPPPDAPVLRKLDCMDCHNRSGHRFQAPETAVDAALEGGMIDRSLPFVKRESVAALAQPYASIEAALAGIAGHMDDFYRGQYPKIWQNRPEEIQATTRELQVIYKGNMFPHMKANWTTYPDNLGHLYWPGCFRCHDGLHVSDAGARITSDCEACHLFLTREANGQATLPGAFVHPMQISPVPVNVHDTMRCDQCHTGAGTGAWGTLPLTHSACGDCHESGRWIKMKRYTFRPMTRPS